MPARRRVMLKGLVVVLGCVAASFSLFFAYMVYRGRRNEEILNKVDKLVLLPPKSMSDLEWAVHVYWTHSLHVSCTPQTSASLAWMNEVDRHLDNAVREGTSMQMLDALWDRYASLNEQSAKYRAYYDKERDRIAELVASQGEEYVDARSYQEFLWAERSSLKK